VSVFVVAEAGVNHDGERSKALALIAAAAKAGADAIKFQTFDADELVSADAPKAAYQKRTGASESQRDMLKRLQLPRELYRELMAACRKGGIRFLSSPFDVGSLEFLVDGLKLDTLKIPSGEITNGPLLLEAGKSGCDIILSTGMSTLAEVEEALGVLAFAMTRPKGKPSRRAFGAAFTSKSGQAALRKKVILLHCTSQYPAPVEDVNLRAMGTMRDAFGLAVGLSDHTTGIAVAIAATALGASVIEKHFTLDRRLPGPDHAASLEPDELEAMIKGIRAVERAMGDGVKKPRPSERDTRRVARKSLVAARHIRKGAVVSARDLKAKRPGTGVSPMLYWERIGKRAARPNLFKLHNSPEPPLAPLFIRDAGRLIIDNSFH